MNRTSIVTTLFVWLCILGYMVAFHDGKVAPASTDCAVAQTTGNNHVSVDWPVGQPSPTNTFAGPPPIQDMFGVLSCGDGRHVETQWLTGSIKATFTWGD